jgi:hypothetical protein
MISTGYSPWRAGEISLDERPFVKNIENVQGDERDVIIFSLMLRQQGRFRVQLAAEPGGRREPLECRHPRQGAGDNGGLPDPAAAAEGAKNAGRCG